LIAGRLDRRIIIEQNVPVTDAIGGETDNWSVFATVWANKKEIQSSQQGENFGADQIFSKVQTKFTIRYLIGVTNLMRIIFNSATFGIIFIKELGRSEGLEIIAQEID